MPDEYNGACHMTSRQPARPRRRLRIFSEEPIQPLVLGLQRAAVDVAVERNQAPVLGQRAGEGNEAAVAQRVDTEILTEITGIAAHVIVVAGSGQRRRTVPPPRWLVTRGERLRVA